MSLVLAWIGHDTHAVASAYIASESRVSWNNGKKYDSCKKVFSSKKYPEIIGYCGDVLFPSLLLSSIIELIDTDLLFLANDIAIERYRKFRSKLFNEFYKYPKDISILGDNFEIIYINKEISKFNYPNYYCYNIKWSRENGFSSNNIQIPKISGIIHIMGEGEKEFKENYKKFQSGGNRNTTRNVFHCLNYTLRNMKTEKCGGPPQLIGLYRKPLSVGISYGIIYKSKRYYNGLVINKKNYNNGIDWHNDKFEICDCVTGKIKQGAQKQPIKIGN